MSTANPEFLARSVPRAARTASVFNSQSVLMYRRRTEAQAAIFDRRFPRVVWAGLMAVFILLGALMFFLSANRQSFASVAFWLAFILVGIGLTWITSRILIRQSILENQELSKNNETMPWIPLTIFDAPAAVFDNEETRMCRPLKNPVATQSGSGVICRSHGDPAPA